MPADKKPDYPTPEQTRKVFDAYKTGKPGAIAEALRQLRNPAPPK